MFEIKEQFSLKKYNTFGLDTQCSYYVECSSSDELKDFLKYYAQQKSSLHVLGGGSNVLFTGDFEGYVLSPNIKGIKIIEDASDSVILRVGAGEVWDDFVAFCVERNLGGIENLSLIPGKVGACPIQNIGAYGVEVKDVIEKVEVLEIESMNTRIFTNQECKFGYRDSIFKRELRGKFIITHVSFRLNKNTIFKLNYGNLNDEMMKYGDLNLKNVRQAVIDIRNSKLPNVEEIGNAGSFFKNPVITKEEAGELKKKYPEMPVFEQGNGLVKIPAGWLIQFAGWKGTREKDAGVHEKQALVIVNYGNATGGEIIHLARNIQQSIFILFGLDLEIEVNVV